MKFKRFLAGMRDAIPIGLGYLTVSFGIGIAGKEAGLDVWQGAVISLLNNASAGEKAGISVIADNAGVLTMILMILLVNARYLLMGCALRQRMDSSLSLVHRMVIGFDVTDELFGMAIAQPGNVDPYYYYGAMSSTMPFWCLGTVLGVLLGNLMPARFVRAFCMMLYGMFIAVFIPAAKKDRVVLGSIAVSFALCMGYQLLGTRIAVLATVPTGVLIIAFTVVISAAVAWLFPHKEESAA